MKSYAPALLSIAFALVAAVAAQTVPSPPVDPTAHAPSTKAPATPPTSQEPETKPPEEQPRAVYPPINQDNKWCAPGAGECPVLRYGATGNAAEVPTPKPFPIFTLSCEGASCGTCTSNCSSPTSPGARPAKRTLAPSGKLNGSAPAQDTNTWSLMKESGARGAGCPVPTAGVTAPSPVR